MQSTFTYSQALLPRNVNDVVIMANYDTLNLIESYIYAPSGDTEADKEQWHTLTSPYTVALFRFKPKKLVQLDYDELGTLVADYQF